jgi:hypothetical protein
MTRAATNIQLPHTPFLPSEGSPWMMTNKERGMIKALI